MFSSLWKIETAYFPLALFDKRPGKDRGNGPLTYNVFSIIYGLKRRGQKSDYEVLLRFNLGEEMLPVPKVISSLHMQVANKLACSIYQTTSSAKLSGIQQFKHKR